MTQNEIHGVRPSSPRILPLPSGERDAESRLLIASIGSSATGNTFDTLIRHPDLLRQWMPFTVALAVTGLLSPRLREIAILRTGWLVPSRVRVGTARRPSAEGGSHRRGDRPGQERARGGG